MPVHSKSVYQDIASVVNPSYRRPINEADAPLKVGATKAPTAEDVIHAITRALETGSDAVKKTARQEAQALKGPMKKALNDLMDACPGFPKASEADNNEESK
jgi:hypothetical protein